MAIELKTGVAEVIRTEIAPALETDGAAIEVVDVSDGIVQLRFTGTCTSCPASMMSLVMGLEQELRARFPEIQFLEVVP